MKRNPSGYTFYRNALLITGILSLGVIAFRIYWGFWDASFNLDGRYFMSAADCIRNGQSPYNIDSFFYCWEERTETPQRSTFVFPPHTLIPTLPLALFERPYADLLILALQFATLALMGYWARVIIISSDISKLGRWLSIGWLLLCLTNGGVLSSIYLGQLSLIAGAGLVGIALIQYSGVSSTWPAALLMVMSKPHLTVFAVSIAIIKDQSGTYKPILLAIVALMASNVWIFVLDPAFLENFATSLTYHSTSEYSKVSDPEQLFGFPGMFSTLEPGLLVISAVALSLLAFICWIALGKPISRRVSRLAMFSALVIIGAMLVPHKQYDFAIYSVLFITAATLPLSVQALIFVPLLVVWRPSLLSVASMNEKLGASFCLLAVCVVFLVVAMKRQKRDTAAESLLAGGVQE